MEEGCSSRGKGRGGVVGQRQLRGSGEEGCPRQAAVGQIYVRDRGLDLCL